MKIKAFLTLLIVSAGGLDAQQSVMKVIKVKGSASSLASLACQSTEVRCRFSDALRSIVLLGQQAQMDSIEQAIKELDAMSPTSDINTKKNIETTIYVLSGSAEPIGGAQEVTGEPLASVVKQLKPIFPYAHYQAVGSMMVRSTDESVVSSEGLLRSANPIPNFSIPAHYGVIYSAQTSADQSRSIHFKDLTFSVMTPYVSGALKNGNGSDAPAQFQQGKILVKSDIDVRDGQKVVVGKANVSESDICFFIVVSARIVP